MPDIRNDNPLASNGLDDSDWGDENYEYDSGVDDAKLAALHEDHGYVFTEDAGGKSVRMTIDDYLEGVKAGTVKAIKG